MISWSRGTGQASTVIAHGDAVSKELVDSLGPPPDDGETWVRKGNMWTGSELESLNREVDRTR